MTASPPSAACLAEAAQWFAILAAHDVKAQDHARWQAWMDADEGNRQAWARVEDVRQQLARLPGAPAAAALRTPATNRRRAAGLLAVVGAAGLGAWMMTRRGSEPWTNEASMAGANRQEIRTGVGEVHALTLGDAAQVWFNAGSEAAVADTPGRQRIALGRGEVFVASMRVRTGAHDLAVVTSQGRVRALGTRFSVRLLPAQAVRVNVFEAAVQIEPAAPGAQPQRIAAGECADFTRDGVGQPFRAQAWREHWIDGVLTADGMRLDDFLAELALHHRGMYPLARPGQVLDMLERTLPVRVRRLTPWWVQVGPA
jgi:transmembrane sensor